MNAGCRIAGCRMQGCRMQDCGNAGCRIAGIRCQMQDAGCRMQISPQSSLPANQPACKSGRHLRNKSSLSCQARLGFHCCPNLRKLAFFATDYRWWAVSAIRTCNRASEHCPCHQTATRAIKQLPPGQKKSSADAVAVDRFPISANAKKPGAVAFASSCNHRAVT